MYIAETKFDRLPLEEKLEHFYRVAERVKSKWDYPKEAKLKLLNFSENATFLVTWGEEEKAIMRVHRTYYAELDNIRTELQWILDLSEETDLNLTTPVLSKNGNYVEEIESPEMEEKRHVVCFAFAEGSAPKDSSDDNEKLAGLLNSMEKIPNFITFPLFKIAAVAEIVTGKKKKTSPLTEKDRKMYRELGRIAATLHNHSDHWIVPDYYSRMEWDWDGTFGKPWNNFYGSHYMDTTCVSKKDVATIDECVQLMKKRLDAYGKGKDRYGMIHSDLRMANLLQDNEKITVLDFDDCGRGWYMYDIGGIVALMAHRSDISEVIKEVISGYESTRPISKADKDEIQTFIMLRRIGMLESINFRIGNVATGAGDEIKLTPEVLVYYAKGTAVLAREYIAQYQSRSLPLPKTSTEMVFSN